MKKMHASSKVYQIPKSTIFEHREHKKSTKNAVKNVRKKTMQQEMCRTKCAEQNVLNKYAKLNYWNKHEATNGQQKT